MSRSSSSAGGDEAPARAGAGGVAWAALVCSLVALAVGTVAMLRGGKGAGISSGSATDLDARLDRNASDLRAQLEDDFKRQVAKAEDVLARAERKIEEAQAVLAKQVEDSRRVADNAVRTSAESADAVEGKVRDVAETTGQLKSTVEALTTSVRTLESRPVTVVAAPAPATKPDEPVKPSDTPAEPVPAAGPTPEQIAANKEKVKAWIADLASPDIGKAFVACANLGASGDFAAVEPLIKAMKEHKDSMVRSSAAAALGGLRACDAVPALIEAFLDRDGGVVLAAGLSFRKISGQDSGLTGSPTRREKTDAHDKWGRWWTEHEKEVRAKLNQPKSEPPK